MVASEAFAALPTTDLAGCQAFAKEFDNTCTTDSSGNGQPVSSVSSWPSAQ